MKAPYSTQSANLLTSIKADIFNRLPYSKEINSHQCDVQVLHDDFATIWVKWGPYNCELKDLPITALGTIADHIVGGY